MGHGRDTSPKPYAVVAEFRSPEELLKATQAARDEGYSHMDTYSPIPVHGITDILDFRDDRLGWAVFGAGVTGALVGLGLQAWVSMVAYPLNVGGKPLFSLPAFVPVTFECTVLFAAGAATFGMLALNGLPRPHHPVMNAECMMRASQDRFVLCIEATDPKFDREATSTFLQGLRPETVEYVETSEGY